MIKLSQVGYTNGDKGIKSIPNMKLGEFRYYVKDNQNINRMSLRKISPKVFVRIMRCLFPDYHLDIDGDGVWGMGDIVRGTYRSILINKGYVCIKESSKTNDGRILYLHDGAVLAYRELFLNSKESK
ncbi:MAG TPA: hypothetical protein PLM93_09900 [Sulfuricurvum sp.]|nr:MAG: hypothetical protein B7X89_08675 [Sulfuricurvum sp. 17-40-25]HQS67482.1 hypothetical protein [Sulfuricurvum sp.]HQT37765.1 hypothetical protein [Sulfuricurvum sp.]